MASAVATCAARCCARAAAAVVPPRLHLAALAAASAATRFTPSSAAAAAATSVRGLAGRAAEVSRAAARDRVTAAPKFVMRAGKDDPFFREVWRKFQLRVHPDLFTQFPALQEANAASLSKLQGVLNDAKSGAKTTDDYLKPRNEELTFYMRTDDASAFLRVPLTLRLPGGECKHVVAEAMARLFKAANLPTRFHWGPEYWQSSFTPRPPAPGDDDDGYDAGSGGGGGGEGGYGRRGRNKREGMD